MSARKNRLSRSLANGADSAPGLNLNLEAKPVPTAAKWTPPRPRGKGQRGFVANIARWQLESYRMLARAAAIPWQSFYSGALHQYVKELEAELGVESFELTLEDVERLRRRSEALKLLRMKTNYCAIDRRLN